MEKKQSLSDKEIPANLNDSSEGKYRRSDLREAVQKLKDKLKEDVIIEEFMISYKSICKEIDEIFGEKLTTLNRDFKRNIHSGIGLTTVRSPEPFRFLALETLFIGPYATPNFGRVNEF